jgi:hypothetical protein
MQIQFIIINIIMINLFISIQKQILLLIVLNMEIFYKHLMRILMEQKGVLIVYHLELRTNKKNGYYF